MLFICRANCEAIPEEIFGTGSTPPSNTCQLKNLTLNLNIDSVEKKTDMLIHGKKVNEKERPKLLLKTTTKINSFNESDSSTKSSAESVDIKQSTEFPLVSHYQEEKSRSLTSTPSYLTKKPPLSPPINYGSQTLEKSVSIGLTIFFVMDYLIVCPKWCLSLENLFKRIKIILFV